MLSRVRVCQWLPVLLWEKFGGHLALRLRSKTQDNQISSPKNDITTMEISFVSSLMIGIIGLFAFIECDRTEYAPYKFAWFLAHWVCTTVSLYYCTVPCIVFLLDWFYHIPVNAERLAVDLRGLGNDDVEAEAEAEEELDVFGNIFGDRQETGRFAEVARRNKSNARRIRLIVRAATYCRVKHGCPDDTPPNRLMCSDTIRRYMVEQGVRESHIATAFPLAVAMALLPLDTDILMAQVLQSTEAVTARRDFTATNRTPWRLRALWRPRA